METYDVVVAGLGVVGSSVLCAAAKAGLRACGLEQRCCIALTTSGASLNRAPARN